MSAVAGRVRKMDSPLYGLVHWMIILGRWDTEADESGLEGSLIWTRWRNFKLKKADCYLVKSSG